VEVRQGDRSFLISRLPVKVLTRIAYASVRGVDDEEGAVQRVLNTRRISGVKEFTLAGGDYPASIVLNWVNKEHPIKKESGSMSVPLIERSAQLIDGQHRVAGLRAALEENINIGQLDIPVAIYEGLTTPQCANIFLSINTEQKPVPRTLVFDLYGIADEQIIDAAAARARDIAVALNEEEDSPYYEQIKLPGSQRRKGGIALSTAVSAIKPLVDAKGDFEQRNLHEFEVQKKVIKNLFSALKDRYGADWDDRNNAFMYASGFVGAIDFLKTKLLSYCSARRSFTKEIMFKSVKMEKNELILQDEVKGKGGKDAPLIILDRLNDCFTPEIDSNSRIEV
jgi:DGQHR domain-containing protein